jgi:hypothetical protein
MRGNSDLMMLQRTNNSWKNLMKEYKKNVGVALEDKRKDTYIPPPPPNYVAYSGSGLTMGYAYYYSVLILLLEEQQELD